MWWAFHNLYSVQISNHYVVHLKLMQYYMSVISQQKKKALWKLEMWDFPGCPVVKNLHFYCMGHGFNPGQETKIPQAMWCRKKKKKQQLWDVRTSVASDPRGRHPELTCKHQLRRVFSREMDEVGTGLWEAGTSSLWMERLSTWLKRKPRIRLAESISLGQEAEFSPKTS